MFSKATLCQGFIAFYFFLQQGGGGGNVILTPNGAKLNGFVPLKKNGVRNGQNHNGHMVALLPKKFDGQSIDSEVSLSSLLLLRFVAFLLALLLKSL